MKTPKDFNEIPNHIRKHNNHYLRINTTQESTGNEYTPHQNHCHHPRLPDPRRMGNPSRTRDGENI